MNSNKAINRKVEKKIRVSEAVKKVCNDHISEWDGCRIDIIYKFIQYLSSLERKAKNALKEDISKLDKNKQAINEQLELLEKLELLGRITINKDKTYTFIINNEKKTECISISLTKQQYEEIDQIAKKYQKEFSQFVRQPFYYFEKYKKFPWE